MDKAEKMQGEKEWVCKPKKKSRTLNFNKWMGGAAAVVSGLMSIGDVFGYMKADWTYVLLIASIVGICGVNYYLRLHTTEPVK